MPDTPKLLELAERVGATPSDIPGLWFLPNGHEITTNQLVSIALRAIAGKG